MYKPCEASSWTLLHQNRKLSSRISLQNQLFCLCRLPAVLYTQKFYLFIVTSFFCYYLFFFCICWKLYITAYRYKWICCVPVYCTCMVLIFYPLAQIFIIGHKGTIFSLTQFCFRVHFFFSYKNVASKSFYKSKIHPFPLIG